LSDAAFYDQYVAALGTKHVLKFPMLDIWLRDFAFSNGQNPILFRYSATAQSGDQKDADDVQAAFVALIEQAGLIYKRSDLFNDGGNVVDDGAGNVVISNKFLRDNHLSQKQARQLLKHSSKIKNIAFIEADERGGLEHADGVVAFVDKNILLVNTYAKNSQYARQLKADLQQGLPNVAIYEIVTPYDGRNIYDHRFGSACGLYINALVTDERIYLPQFGIAEDAIALAQVRAITSKQVIPIDAFKICHMGGGVRCMSWQLKGRNAQKLLNYVEMIKHSQ
ncbi:MAG: agmatine deiminase family protein, partial [Pseudomonadota bacterium]